MVSDGAGGAAEQRGHFGAGLREPEDVVDEQQHILILFVAEVFGDGEARQGDAQASAGGLIHLTVDKGNLRGAEVVLSDHARLGHFLVEIAAFSGALADAGEHRHAAVELRDVVDQLHDDDGLAHTLPPFRKGQIKSMTLMPVASTCGDVDWSTSEGGGRWMR